VIKFIVSKIWFALSLALTVCVAEAVAQPESYSHPELAWKTIETDHFTVSYHAGAERTAFVAAKVAEEIYPPITKLYNNEPDGKVNIIIKDTDDYSNGGAYFLENKIEIWAPSLEFELRGSHNWLRNVVTHEFTHIVTLTAAMKFGRTFPAVYFQYFGYEKVKRPDVLYGFPSTLISYPVAGINVPFWTAEGVAQYQRKELTYEAWDTHRDMLLRASALDKKLFDLDELSNYASKKGIEFELTYNSGYSLCKFINARYGEKKLEDLCKNFASLGSFNVHQAIEKTFDKPSKEFYTEWKNFVEKDYAERTVAVRKNVVEGKIIDSVGFANYHPLFSPDGKTLYYTTNGDADYAGLSALVARDLVKEKVLTVGELFNPTHDEARCRSCGYKFSDDADPLTSLVSSRLQLSPDGKTIAFSRYSGADFHISHRNDIFLFDLASKRENRLTTQARLETPAFSPDGRSIAAVQQADGTANLVTLGLADTVINNVKTYKSGDLKPLTAFKNGEQVAEPVFSKDGTKIYFTLSINDKRRLAVINTDGTAFRFITPETASAIDERNPSLSPDGKALLYSSDKTGIFNIYRLNLETGTSEQLTNVTGGAFMPDMDAKGNLACSLYTSDGFKISLIKSAAPIDAENARYVTSRDMFASLTTLRPQETGDNAATPQLATASSISAGDGLGWDALNHFDDTKLPDFKPVDYTNIYSSLMILPIVRFDTYSKSLGSFGKDMWRSTKLGVAFNSSEILGRLDLSGAVTFAPGSTDAKGFGDWISPANLVTMERDMYLALEYYDSPIFFTSAWQPKYSLEVYHQTRNVLNAAKLVEGIDSASANVYYSLTEIDLSVKFKVPVENIVMKSSTFKIQVSLSPYTSKVGSFFWQPIQNIITASSSDYFIGRSASLFWNVNLLARDRNQEINPVGIQSRFRLDFESDKLQDSYSVSDAGTLLPTYKTYGFTRPQLDVACHLPMFASHTLTLRFSGSYLIAGGPVDNFFNNYISGLLGMRGYEYYAIGGTRTAAFHAEYRLPVVQHINWQFAQFYFDKIYISAYADIGDAWNYDKTCPTCRNSNATWVQSCGLKPRRFTFFRRGFFLVRPTGLTASRSNSRAITPPRTARISLPTAKNGKLILECFSTLISLRTLSRTASTIPSPNFSKKLYS
jgi:Tol biopolymer transport system component